MTRSTTLHSDPRNAARARRFVAEQLRGHDPCVVETATLLASELATNSIRHTTGSFTVTLEIADGTVLVAVTDAGPAAPVVATPAPNDVSGRGLKIVADLADDWGVTSDPVSGNKVWFRLRLGPSRATDADTRHCLDAP